MILPGSDDGGPEGARWPCSWPALPPGGCDLFSPGKEAQPHPVGRDWGGHCHPNPVGHPPQPHPPITAGPQQRGLREREVASLSGGMALWDGGRQEAACGL